MLSALMGGTSAMRAAGKALLPQWPGEDAENYKARLSTATLHPVFRRTVLVNAARPFSKSPVIMADGIPEEWLHDVDRQGSTLPAFANSLLIDALAFGLCGVLVDYPPAVGVRTRADEIAAKVRPYFVKYTQDSILGWKVEGIILSQLRLLEAVEVDDGEWATKTVEQVRVLTPGKWETYRQNAADPNQWDLFESGVTTLNEIPFAFFYGARIAFGHGHSPLLDMAFQNVEHYQSASDQRTILHVARVPILVAIGFGEQDITIGASSAVMSENADASLTYTEHTGAAIASGRQSLLDLEDRMRATGAELISIRQAQTTATQINSEGESAKSTLQQIVEVFEESLEACIKFMGDWIGNTIDVEVTLFKNFAGMPDADPQSLSTAEQAGVISKQTMFEEMQRRDVLSSDRTWKDEQTRMSAQPGQASNQNPDQ